MCLALVRPLLFSCIANWQNPLSASPALSFYALGPRGSMRQAQPLFRLRRFAVRGVEIAFLFH
ncbi:hypothetical protein L682_06255 [Aquipseudomonas alcaligenes OT 69]|nr:hypothetical protein L682_06255 [Pseudomonas alcaligenes OT 69]